MIYESARKMTYKEQEAYDLGYLNGKGAAICSPQPDPITGLVPCGCGGKAILFHQPDIEGPGSDGDRWAVFCEKTCGMETSDMTSREYAVETWNTGMGHKGGAE